jgi:hypothetical protein
MDDMKIKKKAPYPSIGEVISSVFTWMRLWEYLGEEKVALQKKYERLATEAQLRSHDDIEELICETMRLVLPDELASFLAARAWVLLMDGYRQDMRDNATWFNRKETCRWFFRARTTYPLVVAVQRLRNMCRSELVPGLDLSFPPGEFWFLPEKKGRAWEFPGQRVAKWWLEQNDITPEEIESATPASNVTAEAIRGWIGKEAAVPRVSTLKIIEQTDLELGNGEAAKKRSLIVLMMVSGLVKGFFDTMTKLLGKAEVMGFLEDFKALYTAFSQTEKRRFDFLFEKEISIAREQMASKAIPQDKQLEFVQGWMLCFEHEYYTLTEPGAQQQSNFRDRMLAAMKAVQSTGGLTGFYGEDFIAQATRQVWLSNEVLSKKMEAEEQPALRLAVDARELAKGLNLPLLPKGVELARIEVDKFRARCAEISGFEYYANYIDARMLLQERKPEKALESYAKAFVNGRYRAGALMEAITMEYLSVASFLNGQSKGGVVVSRDQLRYYHDWLRLLYPKHEWAEMTLDECLDTAANNFSRRPG